MKALGLGISQLALPLIRHFIAEYSRRLGLSRNITRAMRMKVGERVVNKRRPAQDARTVKVVNLSI